MADVTKEERVPQTECRAFNQRHLGFAVLPVSCQCCGIATELTVSAVSSSSNTTQRQVYRDSNDRAFHSIPQIRRRGIGYRL